MSDDRSGLPAWSTGLPAEWLADAGECAGLTPAVLDARGFPADGAGSANLGLSSFVADGERIGRVWRLDTAGGGLLLGVEWADGGCEVRPAAGLTSLTGWRPSSQQAAEAQRADGCDDTDEA